MTKSEILAPSSPDPLALRELRDQINDAHDVVEKSIRDVKKSGANLITYARDAGISLLAAKQRLPHGQFDSWVSAHCPTISDRSCRRYILIARNWAKISELGEGVSLRAAIDLCGPDSDEIKKEIPRKRPPYLEALNRVTSVKDYLLKHPISGWPIEGRHQLAIELAPLVKALVDLGIKIG